MNLEEKKLDNPVWNSVNESHKRYGITHEGVKFYDPAYCPFGGFINAEKAVKGIDQYAHSIENLFMVGEKPLWSSKLTLCNNLVCNQMLLEKPANLVVEEEIIPLKSDQQKTAIFDLVSLVQPGYFRNKTADLGDYFGIYKEDKLIAVAGERMQMNAYVEISAVVTHPQHTRKGYAKQLTLHTAQQILRKNKIPYLHVLESNKKAVSLYEKLGFFTRRKIKKKDL